MTMPCVISEFISNLNLKRNSPKEGDIGAPPVFHHADKVLDRGSYNATNNNSIVIQNTIQAYVRRVRPSISKKKVKRETNLL